MDKTKLVKFIANVVVSAGATKILRGFVRNNTAPTSMRDKVIITAATVVVGSLIGRSLKSHTEKMVDETIEKWAELKTAVLNLQATIAGED